VTPRLFLRAPAKADLREAFEWYETRSTGLGFEFLRAARAALALIERNPTQFATVLDDVRAVPHRRPGHQTHQLDRQQAPRGVTDGIASAIGQAKAAAGDKK
jgi:hypothetical protein